MAAGETMIRALAFAAAVLTIREPGRMTPAQRKVIAAWLRRQADSLVKDGKGYSLTRYRARHYTMEKAA